MRFRRHCYDKPWRCPGWAGGGWKYPRPSRDICDGGSFGRKYYSNDLPQWRRSLQFHRCDKCGTIAIPHATRWLDPTWWRFVITAEIPYWIGYRLELRQLRRERARINAAKCPSCKFEPNQDGRVDWCPDPWHIGKA